jgi:tetratricopeptide (TPR) repeat protein
VSELPKVPPSNAVKTSWGQFATIVLIYAVLAAMLGAIYSMAGPGARTPLLALFIAIPVAIVLLSTINVILYRRQARRFVDENAQGIAALARGELKIARDIFWRWAEVTKLSQVSALARHNLGWTLMRQGELQQAIDVLTDNDDRNQAALKAVGMYATSAVDLALDYGLLGDLDAAEKWMAEVERRDLSRPQLPAMKAFTRAVLDCRTGRCSDAARMLEERWPEYEATLTGETLRPMRVVRAFAIAGQGPRSAGLAETAIATARPAYPGEYAFLGVAWPEMERFLASHRLVPVLSPARNEVAAVDSPAHPP